MNATISNAGLTKERSSKYFVLLLLISGFIFIALTFHKPLSDFGNYYFGAKYFSRHDIWKVYDAGRFNQAVYNEGRHDLFLDHTSVPPQSILFYKPLVLISDPFLSKAIFNLLGLIFFCSVLLKAMQRMKNTSVPLLALFYFALVIPVYYNILFGQTYLFIGGMILLATMLSEDGKEWQAGFLLATTIALKVSPIVLLLVFLYSKKYRLILSCLLFWCLITIISVVVCGYEVHALYYTELLPRIMNGYVNDPYSISNQGFLPMLRRCFQFDAILNPHVVNSWSVQRIEMLNLLFVASVFFFTLTSLSSSGKNSYGKILLLLVVLNITSGYNAVYSFLILAPFLFLHSEFRVKEMLMILLFLAICAVPSKWMMQKSFFLQNIRFMLYTLLFVILLIPFEIRSIRWQLTAGLMFLFLLMQLSRVFPPAHPVPIAYYHPELFKEDYILDYRIDNDRMTLISFGRAGRMQRTIALNAEPSKIKLIDDNDPTTNKNGRFMFRKLTNINDTLVFLADYGRGPGLFHLFYLPVGQEAGMP